ncbi:MAG: hypothetical protein WDZ93_04090 [Candidatus Paceibacterota bacterium]
MPTPTNKPSRVPRLRTYRDDLARAKRSTATPTEETTMKAPAVPHAPAPTKRPQPERQTPPPTAKPTSAKPAPTPPSAPASTTPQKMFRTETPAATRDLQAIESKKHRIEQPEGTNALDEQVTSGIDEGMIVTDTRKDGFKLFPAIKEALTAWLFKKKEAFQKEDKPKHAIAPAETRRDVIERAATGGVLAPKNDYQQVASRLRHVPRVKISTKPIVRAASEVPKPVWTHEVGTEPPPKSEPEPRPAPPPPKPEPVPEPAPEPKPQPAVQTAAAPEKSSPPPKPKRRTRTGGVPRFSFRRILAYVGIVFVALAAAAAGFGIVSWLTSERTDAPVATVERQFTDPGFAATETIPVALGTTRTGLLTALAREMTGGDAQGITHVLPMVTQTDEATAGEVLTVLAPNAPGAFLRAVTDIEFGAYKRTPFVILKVPNFDTALGGMLAWEQALDEDLEELFGTPVTATVRPTARSTTPTEPVFVDTVHANRDMRVLYDESAEEHLVYSFLNRTTVLITKTSGALTDIAPLVE